jgi:type I restriction enzyme M protein
LKPADLFSELAHRGNAGGKNNFILGDLAKVLTHIEQSTMGSESEEDFGTYSLI